jgi:Ser/Thr protein kinase RdoA (MazF antagonist)
VGRLLGRIHTVGASKKASHRIKLDPATYGYLNLNFLIQGRWIPIEFESKYRSAVEKICEISEPWFKETDFQRIHGDCHFGNLIWNHSGAFFLDFDDMVQGPQVQDIWLLAPGRDEEGLQQRSELLHGYQEMRKFDSVSLRLIEPLRALRFVHYSAWIARRWDDPAFPQAFPQFGTHQYWNEEVEDLEEQLRLIRGII